MNKFLGSKVKAPAKQTGLNFGQAPKKPSAEDADMDADQSMINKANELPKYVPWVEKQ